MDTTKQDFLCQYVTDKNVYEKLINYFQDMK